MIDGHFSGSVQVRRWVITLLLHGEYVRDRVEVGQAVTDHRAQGITTDTAHVVVAPSTPWENLYVAMTRGRESNIGTAPRGSASVVWRQNGCAVAAYRDRDGIVGVKPLGAVAESTPQKLDATRVHEALEAA